MQAKIEIATELKQEKPTYSGGLIKTAADLHILADWIFSAATKRVFVNGFEADGDDTVALLNAIKAGTENIRGFIKTADTLHIATAN